MSGPDQDLQAFFKNAPIRVKRKLAARLRANADRVANAIRQAAPRGATGKLADSVQVRRGRNTLELEVTAGGDATTKEVRAGSGVRYDYALANEFGTSAMPAQPFFWPTWRQLEPDVRADIEAAIEEALS